MSQNIGKFADLLTNMPLPEWGTLTIITDDNLHHIVCKHKTPIRVSMDKGHVRFIDALVRANKLKEADLPRVEALQQAYNRRTGELLVELKLITEADVYNTLQRQLEATLYSLFTYPSVEMIIEKQATRWLGGVPLELELARILQFGNTYSTAWQQIRPVVGSIQSVPKLKDQGNSPSLTHNTRTIISHIDGQRTINDIAARCNFSNLFTAQELSKLVQSGLVSIHRSGSQR